MFGTQDLVILLALGAFFFGAKRLPEIARSLGKSMQEFKKGVADVRDDEARPPSPPPAVTAPDVPLCGACRTPLQVGWTHCPRCGASLGGVESKPSP